MAAPTGIAGQFMYKSESTWSTAVVVDKALEILNEAIKNDVPRFPSKGIRAGRRTMFRWGAGVPKIGGPVRLELPNITVAPLLKHMFGTVATTGSGPYTHTLTPGPLLGVSFTCQVGRPDVSGTVQPFTYAGCKIPDWTLAADLNDYAHLDLAVSAKSETTATALAVASYAGGYAPFTFTQASLLLAGGAIAVNSFTLSAANPHKVDRAGPGSSAIREQLESGVREYSGSIAADFESLTAYNRYVNGTEAALVLTFSNGTDSLTITMNTRFDGETPALAGPEVLSQPLPYVVTSATSDAAAITAVLINSDVTAV